MAKQLSKKFIEEQKKKLVKELKKLENQIERLKKEDPFVDPDHASDNAAVDVDVREEISHNTIEAQIKDLQKRLDDIKLALIRIEKDKYGLCEKCDQLIPLARLKLILEARYCIDCEKKLKK